MGSGSGPDVFEKEKNLNSSSEIRTSELPARIMVSTPTTLSCLFPLLQRNIES